MVDLNKVDPLTTASHVGHVTGPDGRPATVVTPSSFLIRQWQLIRTFVNGAAQNLAALIADVARIDATTITGGGVLGGGGAIGAGNQVITHDDSAVTPGTYGDATHVAQITIDQYGHITAAEDVAISGGGGGDPYFAGSTGTFGNGATDAYATKGTVFVPSKDMVIDYVWGYVDPAAASQNHYAQIAEVTTASGGVISSVLGTSSNVASVTTNMERMRFPFSSPVSLTAGTPYLIAIVNDSGTGTTACRLGQVQQGNATAWDFNAPGETNWNSFDYNTKGLSASQSPSVSSSTFKRNVAIEGTFTP